MVISVAVCECVEYRVRPRLHQKGIISYPNVALLDGGQLPVAAICIRQWCVILPKWGEDTVPLWIRGIMSSAPHDWSQLSWL